MTDSWVLPEPWSQFSPIRWETLRRLVPHHAAVLLLVCPSKPDGASMLGSRAIRANHLDAWLTACAKGDPLLKLAARRGFAVTPPPSPEAKPVAGLPVGMHGVVAAERCSPESPRYWALALGRKNKTFTDHECHLARLMVSLIRSRFETVPPGEPGTQRFLADPGGRLLHVDLRTQVRAMGETNTLQRRVHELFVMEGQRWPNGTEQTEPPPRDLFPPSPDAGPVWAQLRRLPTPGPDRGAAYITLRPIHGIAPPAIGLIEDARVAQAVGVLTDGYADAPCLNDLAQRFDISPFHFQRLFTAQVGISPKHLVLRVQLLHARSALRTTLDPIQHIAARCGFSSHGHFTATFRRMVGITPLDYRLSVAPPASA